MKTFRNPLSDKNVADPFVTYDKTTGYYYLISSSNDEIKTYRSRRIGDIMRGGDSRVIYKSESARGVFGPMWAPEMCKVGDRWYIYTSCQETNAETQWDTKRLLILQSKTEDPFDGFEFGSKPDTSIYAIDPTCAFINGKQYICYSRVPENSGHFGQVLDIREMSNPLTFTDNVAEISRATYPWELIPPYNGMGINEGAFFIERENRLFIVYSGNGCWSDDYCLAVLEYTGGEICDSKSWTKHTQPLFVKGNGIYGTGHASFFHSPDGEELWCAYHCLLHSNPECKEMDRHVCVQKIDFDENGYPVMGEPIGTKHDIASPSGEEE